MKLAIIGATGNVGTRLVAEALGRGHRVTAIARDPAKLAAHDGLTAVAGDANQPATLAPLLAAHDAIVSAVAFRLSEPAKLIEAVRRCGGPASCVIWWSAAPAVSRWRPARDRKSTRLNSSH